MKQYAPACERNSDFILEILRPVLKNKNLLLEIGSGTGQHAAYMAPHFPNLRWLPTDLEENLASIEAWRQDSPADNIATPVAFNLETGHWPLENCDAVLCINTIHIISWKLVVKLFKGVGGVLSAGGIFYVYGPYRYSDRELEPSNQNFDLWLKQRDSGSGIREFEKVNELARENGLALVFDKSMPANNRSICWEKI